MIPGGYRRHITPALLACLATVVGLMLAAGAPAAEGAQGAAEAQPSTTTKPVAALLGTIAATVDQAAGQQALPAPPPAGSAPAPSPVETVMSAATGQSIAPGPDAPPRSDTSEGTAGAPPQRSALDAGATLRKVIEPVRRVTRGALDATSRSVGGVVAQVPAVGQPARRVVDSIATVAGGLLAKTPLAPAVSQSSGLLIATSGGGALTGPARERSLVSSPEAAGPFASSAPTTMIAAPGETPACGACTAGGSAGIPGSTVAAITDMTALGSGSEAALPDASPSASLAAGSVPTSSSPFQMPSTPRSPSPGGGVTSAAGGAAATAGLALALAWLLATVLPGVARRLGEEPQARLIAPFELILQRPG
jgi:hypothetical protein